MVVVMKEAMARQPTGFGRLLCALNTFLLPSQEVAIVGDLDVAETQVLVQTAQSRYLPNTVLAFKRPGEESLLPLLENRELVAGKAAAYVCENYTCKLPVTDVQALEKLLDARSK